MDEDMKSMIMSFPTLPRDAQVKLSAMVKMHILMGQTSQEEIMAVIKDAIRKNPSYTMKHFLALLVGFCDVAEATRIVMEFDSRPSEARPRPQETRPTPQPPSTSPPTSNAGQNPTPSSQKALPAGARKLACSSCGKLFVALPEHIGRKAKCSCGAMIEMTAQLFNSLAAFPPSAKLPQATDVPHSAPKPPATSTATGSVSLSGDAKQDNSRANSTADSGKGMRCGKENHSWEGCKCTKCGEVRHSLEGCKCLKCGEVRHSLEGCKCLKCGEECHSWEGDKCSKCGKVDYKKCKRCIAATFWVATSNLCRGVGIAPEFEMPEDFAGICKKCNAYYCTAHAPEFICPTCGSQLDSYDGQRGKAPQQRLTILPKGDYTIDLGGSVRLEMMRINGGTFQMGSNERDQEKPIHAVTLDGFNLAQTPVTQAQYEAVMGTNPSEYKGMDNPVECVSWNDAVEFCKKLNQRTGQQFRLPTEAEWEYACRAGSSGRFYFGDSDDQLGEYAWYLNNSGTRTHPVGQKRANAWGLYDMHGNVYEWCSDWYGPYTADKQINSVGTNQGSARVFRGGSWNCNADGCRSADRFGLDPASACDCMGFRVVCVPSK